jgi:hypothetical protein
MPVQNHIKKPEPAKVAVILPTLGRRAGHIFDDLMAQTFRDWVCILIDQNEKPVMRNLGPDWYDAGVNEWVPRMEGYFRFVHVHVPWMRGSSNARHLGIAVAAELGAEMGCCVDDDDRLDPDYLAAMVAVLDADDEIQVAVCDVQYSGGNLAPPELYSMPSRMYRMEHFRDFRMDDQGPAQDHRAHAKFAHLPSKHCGRTLYFCGDNPEGGLRAASGRY